jgi:hypothetical protein
MPVDIVIDGLEELRSKLDRFPPEAQNEAGDMVSDYVLNIMREYAPYKYIPYKAAYGGFFSDKQRKYVFANKLFGGRSRTQTLRQGWKKVGGGADTLVYNDVPYAGYVVGDGDQANMHTMIGWWTVSSRLGERATQIERLAKAGVDKAIEKLGL